MPIHRTLAVLALCAPVLLACHHGSNRLTDNDRKEMRAVVDSFGQAVLAQDWPRVVGFYTEDGILMPPNGPAVQGRAAMQTLFESWPKVTGFTESIPEIEGWSDLAYVRGTYAMALNPPGAKAPVKDVGKSLAIWEKRGDGSWLVSRVIWNSDLTPAK